MRQGTDPSLKVALPPARPSLLLNAALALILACLMLLLAQAGFTAEDDAQYLLAADGWLKGAFLGVNHWQLRHPHVLAIAGSFALFGRNELAMMLPTMASYLGIVIITTWLVRRVVSARAAMFAGLIFAATPVFAFYARIPYPDVSELFYCVASFALLWKGLETGALRWFVLSGAAVAMAWLIRSSSVPFILIYGVLFLIGYRAPRMRYLAMAPGFLPLILAEWSYYYVRVGNPFYRFAVDMHSLEIPSPHMVGGVAQGLRPPFNLELMSRWVPNSIVDVHWLVNPYIDFLTNPSFGLLYWAGIAGGVALLRGKEAGRQKREFAWIVIGLAWLWIFVSIYVLNLRPQPRYFLPASWCMCILAGIGLDQAMMARRRLLAAGLLTATILSGIMLVTARRDPMGAERQLVAYVAHHDGRFHSDLAKARFPLEERGLGSRVAFVAHDGAPPNRPFLTSTDMLDYWEGRARYRVEALPVARSLVDKLWNGVAPAALLSRLRPERDLVVLHPLSEN